MSGSYSRFVTSLSINLGFQGFEVTVNGRTFFGFSDYKILPNKGRK